MNYKKLSLAVAMSLFLLTTVNSANSEELNADGCYNVSKNIDSPKVIESNVQVYAYPSLRDAYLLPISGQVKQIGGNLSESKETIPLEGKERVFVSSDASSVNNTCAKEECPKCTNMVKNDNNVARMNSTNSVKSQFKDVPDSFWAKDAIDELALSKVVSGYSDRTFKPTLPILRSELASMAARGMNLNVDVAQSDAVNDISSNWAKNDINAAINAGLISGYPDKSFKPDNPATKAEVFSVMSKAIPGEITKENANSILEQNKGLKNIPNWASNAAAEVLVSNITKGIPVSENLMADDQVSRAEAASMIVELRRKAGIQSAKNQVMEDSMSVEKSAKLVDVKKHEAQPKTLLTLEFEDKISAKTSRAGEGFVAKLVEPVNVDGKVFPIGSKVKGKVIEVARPGLPNRGAVKIKFNEINDGIKRAELPEHIYMVKFEEKKNPNIISRTVAMPLTLSGRLVGIAGRSVGTAANIASNSVEEIGNGLGTATLELLSLKPAAAGRSVVDSTVSLGQGIYNIARTGVSGTVGLVSDTVDEAIYFVYPKPSNSSSINPNEIISVEL